MGLHFGYTRSRTALRMTILYTLLLVVLAQLLQNWKHLPGADFVATYNPIIWGVICAVVGMIYGAVASARSDQVFGWVSGLGQVLIIAVVANAISLALYILLRTEENIQTAFLAALYFFFLPSIVILPAAYVVVRFISR